MLRLSHVLIATLIVLGACTTDSEEGFPSDDRSDSTEVIEYRRPEAPTPIEVAPEPATTALELAYGHCDPAVVDDDGAITINCESKWSEMAWLSISKETTEALVNAGKTRMAIDLSVSNATIADSIVVESVRFAIRSIDDAGEKTIVFNKLNVLDGESIELDIAATEYEILFARAANSVWRWEDGVVNVDLTVSVD